MGIWGTEIKDNYTFADIYGEFFEHYNKGESSRDISTKLIADNQELINDFADGSSFNSVHEANDSENYYPSDYRGFLLALAESKDDIYIGSQFESELVTNELYSKFIEIQLTEIVKR